MTKFNPGDKVRVCESYCAWHNKTGIVRRIIPENQAIKVDLDEDDLSIAFWGSELELIPRQPLSNEDFDKIKRALVLLEKCPPTIRQIIDAGDEAIEAAGLNPWCINEGLAKGNETQDFWWVSDLLEKL